MKIYPHLVLVAVASLAPAAAAAREDQGSFERTLKVSGAVELDVETGSGGIEVRGVSGSNVVVRATIYARNGYGRSAEEKIREIEANPPVRQSGNIIRIGEIDDRELRRNISIHYDITTPTETRLHAQTGSGGVTVEKLKGPANVSTGSGRIEVYDIGDRVEAHTGSGGIRGGRIAGAIVADTGSGGVNLEQTNLGSIDAHTGSGSVTIRVPSQAAFDLRAHTGSGSITVDHPMTVSGTIGRHDVQAKVRGGGNALVDVRTGSGSIHIE